MDFDQIKSITCYSNVMSTTQDNKLGLFYSDENSVLEITATKGIYNNAVYGVDRYNNENVDWIAL